jgi:hypothetical protein
MQLLYACGGWLTARSDLAKSDLEVLFDRDWYVTRHPAIAHDNIDAFAHFLWHGRKKGHDPHPLFDTSWYLAQNPDVAKTKINPLIHYVEKGAAEGRDPHPLFSAKWYLAQQPDLAQKEINPLVHFLQTGARENRDPHPLFDIDWYVARYPEVARENALVHYILSGSAAGYDPNPLFDTSWYLARYPKVAQKGLNPLLHFIRWGHQKGFDPHPLFDTDWYCKAYPEVARKGQNPLIHYIVAGARERKNTHPSFHPDALLLSQPSSERGDDPLLMFADSAMYNVIRTRNEAATDLTLAKLRYFSALEPELKFSLTADRVKDLKLTTSVPHDRASRAWVKLFNSLHMAYDYLIFIPGLGLGVPQDCAINAMRALHERHGVHSVLLIATDNADTSGRGCLSEEAHFRSLSDFDPQLTRKDRVQIVRTISYFLMPKSLLNVGSAAASEAICDFGAALSNGTKLFTFMFDPATKGAEQESGEKYFRSFLTHAEKIYCDGTGYRELLIRRFGLQKADEPRLATIAASIVLD